MPVIEIYVGYMDGRWDTQLIYNPHNSKMPSEAEILEIITGDSRSAKDVAFCGVYNEDPISVETEEENELP